MCRKSICLVSFVFVLALVLTNFAQADLIGYWRFDESSGTTAADSAGGDNDGTLVGTELGWAAGRSGGALSLWSTTESTEGVEFPTTGMSTTSGTIAMWGFLSDPQPETSGRYFFGHTTDPRFNNRIQIYMQEGTTPSTLLDIGLGDAHALDTDIIEMPLEQWLHVALTWDAGSYFVYVNGEEVSNGTYSGLSAFHPTAAIGNDGSTVPYEPFAGLLDEVQIYNNALSAVEILSVMQGEPFPLASGPTPKEGALLLDTWANLSWRAGEFAVSHDIYVGDNFDDVDAGAESTFVGNQEGTFIVVGFPGFPIPDGLAPGTTYYWRIDEVNETEPNSPWKGDIWSFSIAPKTAYDPIPADGAETVAVDVELSWTEGFGGKLHTVYFGDNFDEVNNAAGGQSQGTTTFTPGTLEMAKTYYWRVDEFDIAETHKGDVWSFTTEGAVGSPDPANGAEEVTQTPVLTWVPGVFADTHEVYFGTDEASMELKGSGNLGAESFEPGQLEWNTTYYWRVNEANNANANSPWTGPLWSFTTANFLIIDDMEGYNDLDPADPASNRIFNAWIDGFGDPTNGSLVGYATPPFAEQTIVHSGNQSMPLEYDNAVGKSEATSTLTSNRNWTVNGVNTLTVWHRGNASNAAENMYVALNDSAVVNNDDPDAAKKNSWTQWNIDLQAFADQGVNLVNVSSITLGLGNRTNPVAGGSGMMYYDDIRLYAPVP
ncbi:MAG: LamG domain-containing protein [Planctomycetes bacterium]|nr:LamG domain-containing protein [Planctomycetota bacterium]